MKNAFDKSISEYKHHISKAIECIDRLGEEFKFVRSILSEIDDRISSTVLKTEEDLEVQHHIETHAEVTKEQ